MRKLGIAILVVVIILVGAALIVPRMIDINQYHGQIQTELEKKLGRHVSLGPMRLSLFPPSFQAENTVIGEDDAFKTNRPFASVGKLAVSVKLLPLLRKDVEIKSLELDQAKIELVKNERGEWNFATLGPQGKPAPAAKVPASPGPGQQSAASSGSPERQPAGQFELANLQINDGQVALSDEQKRQPRVVYDHIDLKVSDFAPNQEFSLDLSAHLPGQGKQTVSLQGKGGPIQQANLMNTSFDGALRLDQVSISGAQKFLNSQALQGTDGLISGNAKVRNAGGKLASNGSFRLDDPRIRNVNVGYPVTLDYDVTDDLAGGVIQVHRGDLKLGQTSLGIAGVLDIKPVPAQIDLKFTASHASIAEAARLAAALGVAFGQGMNVNGQIDADIQARGPATLPAMNGRLSIHDLAIGGKDLPQPVKASAIDMTLTPDAIRSNDFTATTGSTSVNVNFVLSQYASPHGVIAASLRAANAQIGELLNMAKAYGVSAVDGMSGSGLLSLDVRAQGPVKDPSALNFNGSGKIQNASLKMPSLTQPIEVHNADIGFDQNSATLRNLAASVGHTNATGSVTLKNFAAPQAQFALNADKVNIGELQQLVGAAPPPAKTAAGNDFWRVVPAAQAQSNARTAAAGEPGALTRISGGGTVNIGTVQYDNLTLTNLRSTVVLDHGLIHFNPITSALYGGQELGTVTLDMRPAQPVYTANLNLSKVDANQLISAVSPVKQVIYGLLTTDANASFSSSSADSITRSLNGTVGVNLNNGKIAHLDLLHELASVGKFLGGPSGAAPKEFTNLVQLTGNFDVKNGVAQTNNLKAVIEGGTLAATGLVNLVDQSLNLHVTAVLDKAMSQQVGGSQIGGFMNTALANNQGELVVPVIVTGTFQHPQVAPDVQQVAQMKLKNLLPTTKNPGQLTSGLVGAFLGKQIGGANSGKPNGIGGILGALGGKQQTQQPPSSNQAVDNNNQQQQQQNQDSLKGILGSVLGKKKKPPQNPPPQP